MKKLIAWDTSSKTGVIVALEWDENQDSRPRLVSEWSLSLEATHSERLLWGIHQLLEGCRWSLEEIDIFGVGLGPGSFTGLRIGITTARTLSHILKKPLVGVSSLAALARPAALWAEKSIDGKNESCLIIASTDACKGELFALWGNHLSVKDCIVKAERNYAGVWKRGVEEKAVSPSELMQAIEKKMASTKKKKNIILKVGNGRKHYLEEWKRLSQFENIDSPYEYCDMIQGRYLGLLVWEGFQAGLGREALSVNPRYLRASNAELKLLAGELPVAPGKKKV